MAHWMSLHGLRPLSPSLSSPGVSPENWSAGGWVRPCPVVGVTPPTGAPGSQRSPVGIRARRIHTMLALPQPLRESTRQLPRRWLKSLWPGCVYRMSPLGASGQGERLVGVFSSICLEGWKTTKQGGGTGLEAALGLSVGVAWLAAGGAAGTSSQRQPGSLSSSTQGPAPAESPLNTPTVASAALRLGQDSMAIYLPLSPGRTLQW